MRRSLVRLGLGLGAVSGLFGCEALFGIDEPTLATADAGAAAPVAKTLAKQFAQARCNAMRDCFGTLHDAAYQLFREEDCETLVERVLLQRDFWNLDASIAAGGVAYDPAQLDACLMETTAQSCELDLVARPVACLNALKGRRGQDDPCYSHADCAEDTFCDVSSATLPHACPGRCRQRRASGEPCVDTAVRAPQTARECSVGLLCVQGKCVAAGGPGAACSLEPGSSCMTGFGCQSSVCERLTSSMKVPGGGDCQIFQSGMLCASGLGCAMTVNCGAGTCEATTPVNACRNSYPELCPKGQHCPIPEVAGACAATPTGACVPLPAATEACTGSCAGYSRCLDGECRKLSMMGEACTQDRQCYSGRCETQCVAVVPCGG
jgi:hypothetical protein